MAGHSSLSGADLHEPKGIGGATANQVYVANGSSTGAWTSLATWFLTQTTATFAEITRACAVAVRLVLSGATLSLTQLLHDGKTVLLNFGTGGVYTLPASTGSGARFKIVVKTPLSSGTYIVKVANSSDIIQGTLTATATDVAGTVKGWATAAADDTITMNGTTTGAKIVGDWFELEDIVANTWALHGNLSYSGTGATPFSNTV